MTKSRIVNAGEYWGRRTENGPLEPAPPGVPDQVICRRLCDFGPGQLPAAAAITACSQCGFAVAFNPQGRYPDKPKLCMQCAHIIPLPIETTP